MQHTPPVFQTGAEEPFARLAPFLVPARSGEGERRGLPPQKEVDRRRRQNPFVGADRGDGQLRTLEWWRRIHVDGGLVGEAYKRGARQGVATAVRDKGVRPPVGEVGERSVGRVHLRELDFPCGVSRRKTHDAANHPARGRVADVETDEHLQVVSLHGGKYIKS